MKSILIIISLFLLNSIAIAQELEAFVAKGVAYVNYEVKKSEGINYIAAKYALTPAELTEINSIEPPAVLQEGQLLKIPVSKIISPVCKGENCVKVYYDVQQSEGLYRIGVNYGNTKIAQLKQLNNLSSESVSVGQKLLVGYLQLNKADIPKLAETEARTLQAEVILPGSKNESSTEKKQAVVSNQAGQKLQQETKAAVVTGSIVKPGSNNKPSVDTITPVVNSNSFFESQYVSGNTESIVIASTFKSESGWSDGKFYVLMDNITAGAIVKITNPLHAVCIYAKVLGELPSVKDKENIKMRISNAGASALKILAEDHFEVQIIY